MKRYLLTALVALTVTGAANAQEGSYMSGAAPTADPSLTHGLLYQGVLLEHETKSQNRTDYDGSALLSAVSTEAGAIISRSLKLEKREKAPAEEILVTAR